MKSASSLNVSSGLPGAQAQMEIGMDADEWRKKREALIGQLRDLEAGRISH